MALSHHIFKHFVTPQREKRVRFELFFFFTITVHFESTEFMTCLTHSHWIPTALCYLKKKKKERKVSNIVKKSKWKQLTCMSKFQAPLTMKFFFFRVTEPVTNDHHD